MILVSFLIGGAIDIYLPDHPVTLHYKVLGGVVGAGAVLFLARNMKGVVLRKPIKKEEFC